MKIASDKSGDRVSRRRFLANTSALGAASFLGLPRTAAAEPPPEIPKIRLVKIPAICLAPEYLAEELLRLEGFTEVEYVETDVNGTRLTRCCSRTGRTSPWLPHRRRFHTWTPANLWSCLPVSMAVATSCLQTSRFVRCAT